jgi:hypothetical protein
MTSVRLWLGWRAVPYAKNDDGWDRFVTHLSATFIPATWQVMRAYGLLTYVPSVLSADPGTGLPEEVALLCYTTPEAYDSSKKTVAGRSYSVMHEAIFDCATDGRHSRAYWAKPGVEEDDKPARRLPLADGLDFDDASVRIHMLVLRHPGATALRPQQLWQALSAQRGGLAAWCKRGYSVLWVASDVVLQEGELVPQLIGLAEGSSVAAFHLARPTPVVDEAIGLPRVEQASWHFHP